jgi:sulfur-carrier protein
MEMRITVKLFANLRTGRFTEENREVREGTTVIGVLQGLGIPEDQMTLAFVNGRHAKNDTELTEGDVVAFFPPIGGG